MITATTGDKYIEETRNPAGDPFFLFDIFFGPLSLGFTDRNRLVLYNLLVFHGLGLLA